MTFAATALSEVRTTRQAVPEGIELTTTRLELRPMGRADVERIYETNRNLNEDYMAAPALDREALEELRGQFELEWRAYGMGYLMVFHAETDMPVGHVRLKWIPGCASGRAAALTYAIDAPYQCRGYATEAVAAVLRFAFTEAGLDYVVACVEPDNIPSVRVVEKNMMAAVAEGRTYHRRMRRYLMPAAMWKAKQRTLAREAAKDIAVL